MQNFQDAKGLSYKKTKFQKDHVAEAPCFKMALRKSYIYWKLFILEYMSEIFSRMKNVPKFSVDLKKQFEDFLLINLLKSSIIQQKLNILVMIFNFETNARVNKRIQQVLAME